MNKGVLVGVLVSIAALSVVGVSGIAVMSVDIGSEWMKVAVVSPGVPMEIALNPESKRKTSVAVSIENGERKFGSDAMNVCIKKPNKCFVYLLDLLGKKLDHPLVQDYHKRFPHYTLEATDRGTVQFRVDDETAYTVEELLGMILNHAKQQAEDFTQQKIKDAVITVPVFFNQAERLALVAAGQLAGVNILQLMSEPTAVALNYGMFRRKEINGTVKHIMFYDMGAQDTTVSIVGFQVVKIKERGYSETHPQAQVLGLGFDRTLGGAEIKFRLREYLADQFNDMKKTKTDVRTNFRGMGKLLKEAERVKLILSANTECYAQIENVMEDIDFKVPMSREKLEELCADLWPRVTKPIDDALAAAGMSLEHIDQVILIGGGTRVPRVQELLVKHINKDLGKNMNTDESAAMGAVYKAADLSAGFKVKKFITKDAVIYPIDVDFERELEASEVADGKTTKKIRRTLFSRMNPYPQKKIMTFNKHVKDFTFYVNYDDVDYLGEREVQNLGSRNVTSVLVKGVGGALDKNTGDNVEAKGVKAHFILDDSGILSVTGVESVFERTISVEEQEKEEKEKEDTWSKLGETFSQLFSKTEDGGDSEDKDAAEKEDAAAAGKKDEAASEDKENNKTEKKDGSKKKDGKKEEKKKEPKKPKQETIKEELSIEEERLDVPNLDGESFETSRARLEALDKADKERLEREGALNELESFVFDLQDKMYQEEYEVASTSDERDKIVKECSVISEWLDEEAGPLTDVKEFNSRMKTLKEMSSGIMARVREHRERPEMLESLEQVISSSRQFVDKSANLTGEDGLLKEKELQVLAKKVDEIEKWRDEKIKEQEETPLSEMPKLTVSLIGQKISDIDSEVKFLVQKAKMAKAEKERARRLKEAEEKKAQEAAKKAAKEAEKEAADSKGEAKEDSSSSEDSSNSDAEDRPDDVETPSKSDAESDDDGADSPKPDEDAESASEDDEAAAEVPEPEEDGPTSEDSDSTPRSEL